MTSMPFSFGNAVSHYSKTGGPGGFLWRFALTYALIGCVLQAVSVWLQWPLYEIYIRMFTEGGGDIDPYIDDINRASATTTLGALLVMPFGLLLWLMFEAASQRRYMRAEGFRLRIGADEGRLFVVGLIWIALFIGMYIGLAVMIIIPAVAGFALGSDMVVIAVLLGVAMVIAYMLFALWLSARLSAAAALTIRDRQIRFFESWRVTKGKGWTIVGAWIVLGLIMIFAIIVFYIVAAALGFGMIAAQVPDFTDEAAVTAAVMSPAFWGPMLLVLLGYMMLGAAFMHIYGGPAALAARTDPAWIGLDVAGEFQ